MHVHLENNRLQNSIGQHLVAPSGESRVICHTPNTSLVIWIERSILTSWLRHCYQRKHPVWVSLSSFKTRHKQIKAAPLPVNFPCESAEEQQKECNLHLLSLLICDQYPVSASSKKDKATIRTWASDYSP